MVGMLRCFLEKESQVREGIPRAQDRGARSLGNRARSRLASIQEVGAYSFVLDVLHHIARDVIKGPPLRRRAQLPTTVCCSAVASGGESSIE